MPASRRDSVWAPTRIRDVSDSEPSGYDGVQGSPDSMWVPARFRDSLGAEWVQPGQQDWKRRVWTINLLPDTLGMEWVYAFWDSVWVPTAVRDSVRASALLWDSTWVFPMFRDTLGATWNPGIVMDARGRVFFSTEVARGNYGWIRRASSRDVWLWGIYRWPRDLFERVPWAVTGVFGIVSFVIAHMWLGTALEQFGKRVRMYWRKVLRRSDD